MVTIGLPVYNAERFLKFTLNSILSQSYTKWNLIIINDGSTDSSDQIVKQYLPDKRIKYIHSDNNIGLIARLNELVNLSKTKYFFRMDADDIMHPDRLKIQLEFLENNPSVDVIGTSAISIDEQNSIIGIKRKSNNFGKESVLLANPFIHPSLAGKTQWFKENKYDPKYFRAEDKELWLRTYEDSSFYNIDTPLLYYREGKVSIKNYLDTGKTLKLIYRDYKNKFSSDRSFIISLWKVELKNKIYHLASLFHFQNYLTQLRSERMDYDQKINYENVLRRILVRP